jgi:hypothetical protein
MEIKLKPRQHGSSPHGHLNTQPGPISNTTHLKVTTYKLERKPRDCSGRSKHRTLQWTWRSWPSQRAALISLPRPHNIDAHNTDKHCTTTEEKKSRLLWEEQTYDASAMVKKTRQTLGAAAPKFFYYATPLQPAAHHLLGPPPQHNSLYCDPHHYFTSMIMCIICE